MHRVKQKLVFTFIVAIFLWPYTIYAQTPIAKMKHKCKWLKGEWQLVRTYTDSTFHAIEKSEYDAVIRIKPMHHFEEEVWYEGYHWIIKGKWYSKRKTDSLCFINRTYTYGKLEEKPSAIRYVLSELNKEQWTGNSIAEGEKVQLTYQRIERKKRKQNGNNKK